MKKHLLDSKKIFVLICIYVCVANAAFAADAESVQQLDEMVIKSDKPAVPANLPSTTEGVTAKQIGESVNSVSSAGALLFLPNVHVRERFMGDEDSGLAMRMYGVNSSAGTIVYANGLLLSNFLTNSCCPGPRWGMVSPEEIDRVDVIYGPFSALYPGNSVGGVVLMTTHMPAKFEAHAKLDAFGQNFKLYGTDKNFTGVHGAVTVGHKVGDWSFWLSGDHLDNHSHPQSYSAAAAKTGAAAVAGQFTDVTGASFDSDIANKPRVITAASNMDHTVKVDGKIKVAYDFSSTVQATYLFDIWQNTSDNTVDSYLRDADGNTIYGTGGAGAFQYVRINGKDYRVTSPSVGYGETENYMHGLSVKSNSGGTWDWEATASYFIQNKEVNRASSGNFGTTPPSAATAGTISFEDGTGFKNLDLRGEWRPGGDLKSEHQVSFGFHTDTYTTKLDRYNLVAGNWRTSAAGALSANSRGETNTQALYLQDAWQFDPAWKLVVGGRAESWKASNGSNYANNANVTYRDSSANAFSPKLSLAYQASDDWALRGSYGRATRFPTVGELFKNIGITLNGITATTAQLAVLPVAYQSTKTNNPNLKPESADSWEFTAERFLESGLWRTSLFGEEKRDALIQQSDTTTLAAYGAYAISSVQNVDKVRTYGIETALQTSDMWMHGLDLSGSVAYIHSRVVKNSANPGLENTWPHLIPDWRATLLGTFHASDKLSYSLVYRFSGRQRSGLFNTTTKQYPDDPNPNAYGGRSSFRVFDVKALYKFTKQWSASVGIDNIGNFKYYTLAPYPQRTFFGSVKFDY